MVNSKYQDCIDACQKCIVVNQDCLINMAGQKSMNDCPKCCVVCIDACYVSVKMMAADSQYAEQYCKICAEVCDYCAGQCAEHDHEHCQACAKACRECAEACRKMMGAMAA